MKRKINVRAARPAVKRAAAAASVDAPGESIGVDGAVKPTFSIVGVGASAGGLEAFSLLLQHIPRVDGMALVLIQHLDPTHTSFLREALLKTTTMPVQQAEHGMRVEAGHVYVIPPNTALGIHAGHLLLAPRSDDANGQHLPVDHFFRSLAAERGSRAIGVVLSGSASDGTEGLRAIREANGITFAQDPASAKFDGMPRSAVDAGVVDHCLPIPALAETLVRISQHPYVTAPAWESTPAMHDAGALEEIFALVRHAARVDFSEYKSPTFQRRLARRMALRTVESIHDYLKILRESPDEVMALYEETLIHVTSFFRDPVVFESLKASVLPAIVKAKADGASIRVWVAGCATGEEVYSLGIALLEFLGTSSRPIQIFGSDVNSKAIQTARAGFYPDSALRDVSDERRRRYFTKVDRGYRIIKSIRELCVFVQHDLARDPPFSKLDLVSCRNVLIYFDQALQKRVVPTFHYALSQPGFLLLGHAENIGGFKQLFDAVDKTNKIFARTAVPSTLWFARRAEQRGGSRPSPRVPDRDVAEGRPEVDLSKRLDRLLLARYAPPGIVVNGKMEIVQFRGQTGGYLQPAPGEPRYNLMQMAREGLPMMLRATIAKAKEGALPVRTTGVEFADDGSKKTCDVVVIPLVGASNEREALYVVLFEEPRTETATTKGGKGLSASAKARDKLRLPKLERELAATKEYVQMIMADHGRTNEDLGAANEELVSSNEELQSMNEELETAKEELQSLNEELTTVNEELQNRNHEAAQINGDLVNLLTTVDIPILILDSERKIRRFTPKARRILNVLASDVGRPFADIKPNIRVPDLDQQISDVIDTMAIRESEVQDHEGRWYRLQIRPYKTTDNRIDGAIVSLVDIDALKHLIEVAQLASTEAERANRTKDEFLATLSHELRTPLSSMLMRAQLLARGGMEPDKVMYAGEAIEAGVRMQVQLIDDLLDVSRIVTGKLNTQFEPVDLEKIVTSAVEGLTLAFERRSLAVEVKLTTSEFAGHVYGDARRLEQIVTNLLTNAIKFTPKLGTVRVSFAVVDGRAVLRVADTGMGIEAGFLPFVFNRFTQENATSTRAYGGLGLGLAIVRHLVELHHGTVTAESPGVGKGATFTVTFPVVTAMIPAPPLSEASLARAALDFGPLAGLRILVVDDDRASREAIADVLEQTGATVRLAQSSAEATAALEEFRPELLLCDVAMPDEDGYTFIRALRSRGAARFGDVPALALTALAHDEDRDRALAAGFQMHVSKPVDIDRFKRAVLALSALTATKPLGDARS